MLFLLQIVFILGDKSDRNSEFTSFILNARSATTDDKQTTRYSVAGPKRVGRFQLFDDELTQFNFDCVNTISEADNTPKSEIQVMWVAPAAGSGCVALSAMVYKNSNAWYADEGNLTYIICEGAPVREGSENECCACDEAKYNVCISINDRISMLCNCQLAINIWTFFFYFSVCI